MEITLLQQILLKGKPNTYRSLYKKFKSNIIPHKGDMITDSVWKDPYQYEVHEVAINYDANECYVTLGCIELDSVNMEHIKHYIKMAKLHRWECNIL